MNTKLLQDNGYISNHLIHWTGRRADDGKGAETLSEIVSSCRLLLSSNQLYILDLYHEIHSEMVCFTDVPLSHSGKHCMRYGKFGVAFHKLKLMNVGAQPVFYATHGYNRDMIDIFKFLREQNKQTTIEEKYLKPLLRHFYFIQHFSKRKADGDDTFYYEREWRLGKQTLIEKSNQPNPKYRKSRNGYPPCTGCLEVDKGKNFFKFDKDDVAFLIVPRGWQNKIKNPHKFDVSIYEDIVPGEGLL